MHLSDDSTTVGKTVYKALVGRFLNVSTAQYTKDYKLKMKREKGQALRKKVMIRQQIQSTKSSSITMQDILNDKSDAKQNTHLKLKLNLSENKDFICTNQTYQKNN